MQTSNAAISLDAQTVVQNVLRILEEGYDVVKAEETETGPSGSQIPVWHRVPHTFQLPVPYLGITEAWTALPDKQGSVVKLDRETKCGGCYLEEFENDFAVVRLENGETVSVQLDPSLYCCNQTSVEKAVQQGYEFIETLSTGACFEYLKGELVLMRLDGEVFIYFAVSGRRWSEESANAYRLRKQAASALSEGKTFQKVEGSDTVGWLIKPSVVKLDEETGTVNWSIKPIAAKLDEPYKGLFEIQFYLPDTAKASKDTKSPHRFGNCYLAPLEDDGVSTVKGDCNTETTQCAAGPKYCLHLTREDIKKKGYEILSELTPFELRGKMGTMFHLSSDGKECLYFDLSL